MPSKRESPRGGLVYMIRGYRGKDTSRYIGVPKEFADMIPEQTPFVFSVTDNGFAYTPIPRVEQEGMPAWLEHLRADGGEQSDAAA